MSAERKLDHIKICLEKQVEAGDPGFDRVVLKHFDLPEINFDEISMKKRFLGKKLEKPFLIEAMTGGSKEGEEINKSLAKIAEEFGLAFGVGSQRVAIENPKLEKTFWVRDVAPSVLLIANLGAVQLNYGYSLEECEKAVEMIDADALALHLNPLQEIIQPEGNRNFSNLIEKINLVAKELKKPVIVKSVGCGISYDIANKLKVKAIDVSGVGGTSWALIEGYRSGKRSLEIAKKFSDWGLSTVDSLLEVSKLKERFEIIASGGIRDGIHAAKSFALGADIVGMALPLLRILKASGKNAVKEYLDKFFLELKIAMFLTSSRNVDELYGKYILK
mgnify:CR=1 FL=1